MKTRRWIHRPAPIIEKLKAQGHSIQLWSTGGAEYALRIATERGLADLFDSFGTKPDVAFDDIPEAVHPTITFKVDQSFRLVDAVKVAQSNIEACVETSLCPSPRLVSYVGQIQQRADIAKLAYKKILRDKIPFHPIPFFGNVSSARIITIGLNPSSGEFEPWRCWPEKFEAQELTSRLVGYFYHSHPRPHPWFAELQEAMSVINCSFSLAAAHVDISPWPTLAPTTLMKRKDDGESLNLYNKMIVNETVHLPGFLKRCKFLKLVFIIGKTRWGDFIKRKIEEKINLPVNIVDKKDMANWISDRERDIRQITGWPPNVF